MSATFKLEGSGAGAVKAVQDFQKALKAAEQDADKAAKSTRGIEREAQRLADKADPVGKYNRKLQELAQFATRGAEQQAIATKAASQLGVELERTTRPATLLNKAVQSLGSNLTNFISVSAGLGAIAAAFRQVEQEAQSAADKTFEAVAAFGELQQVSANPKEFSANTALARRLAGTGAFSSSGQAAKTAFNIRSGGITSATDLAIVDKLLSEQKISGESAVDFFGNAKKIQNIFGADAGSFSQVINRANKTSSSTLVGPVETIKAATAYAEGARSAGLSESEALAVFAPIEGRSKSPEASGERLKSFFSVVNKSGLGGGGIDAILGRIDKQVAGGKTAYQVLGEENAVTVYSTLKRARGELGGLVKGIEASSDNGLVQQQSLLATDPILGPALERRQAEAQLELEKEKLGRKENLLQTIAARRETSLIRGGESAFSRFLGRAGVTAVDYLGAEGAVIAGAATDPNLPATTRLQAAQYTRDNSGGNQELVAQMSRVISILERQLDVQESGSKRVKTRQE